MCRCWKAPPRDADCSPSAPSATASCAGCRWSCWRRADHALAEFRDAARGDRRHHDADPDPTRPASRASPFPGFEIPTDRNGQLWVHFAKHDPARYVSADDVLEGSVDPDRIAGKLVLIGTSAVGLLDVKTTPIDPVMPGVEVHAQVLESVADALGAVVAELCDRCRACSRDSVGHRRSSGWRRSSVPPLLLLFGGVVIALLVGTSWYFLVEQQTADRLHVSAAVEPADLSHVGVQQLL